MIHMCQIFDLLCDRRRGRDWKRMESMKNRLEIEREYTLTPKVQKLNQKVHCRARGRHVACSSRAIATRWPRHTVKKPFRSAADTVDLSVPQAQGCARRRVDGKRSFSDHARTTRGLQNWTLCTTKHLPTRHRRRPRHGRWGRCRCCCRRRWRGNNK